MGSWWLEGRGKAGVGRFYWKGAEESLPIVVYPKGLQALQGGNLIGQARYLQSKSSWSRDEVVTGSGTKESVPLALIMKIRL